MAKILDSSANVTGRLAKMVELPQNYIFNGKVYDKNTLSPIGFEFLETGAIAGYDQMYTQTTMFLTSYYVPNVATTYVVDNNDPSIYYMIYTFPQYGGKIEKYQKIDGKIIKLLSVGLPWSDSTLHAIFSIYFQDNDSLYLTCNKHDHYQPWGALISYNHYIVVIRKSDLANTHNWSLGTTGLNSNSVNVGNNNNFMYIATRYNEGGFQIHLLNRITKDLPHIFEDNSSSGSYRDSGLCSLADEKGLFYSFKDSYYYTNKHFGEIICYKINYSLNSVEKCNINVDFSYFPNEYDRNIEVPSNTYGKFDLVRHESENNRYVSLIIYTPGEGINLNHAGQEFTNHRIYTFEIIDDDNLKLVWYKNFGITQFSGYIMMKNNVLLIGSSEMVLFYQWNNDKKQFIETGSHMIPAHTIGVDAFNDVWVMRRDTQLDLITAPLPMTLSARFKEERYIFKGEDIFTEVIVTCENYLKRKIPITVELFLTGKTIFTENNKQTIVKTTSDIDDLHVPVTIIGKGFGEINVRLK